MDAPTRVLTALNHEEPDRVPSFESAITNNSLMKHYGLEVKPYYPSQKVPDNLLKLGSESKDYAKTVYRNMYEFYKRIGIDLVVSLNSLFPRKSLENGKRVDEYGRIMRTEIYEKDGTPISGYVGGYFRDFEDYESWEQPDPFWDARMTHYLAGREVQKELNNEIFSIPAVGALMECSWECFGMQNFSRLFARPKQIRKVFDDRGKFTLEVVKQLADQDAKIVLLWDDFGFKNGLFMSPMQFKNYIFPWYRLICDEAHKRDCKILLHSDGDLSEIFRDLIDVGVDVFNPIEPTTANPEYDIFKLNEKFGDKITLAGNLSPMMLALGKISEIEAYAKKLIKEIAPGGGYLFSSGHSINPAVTVDRFEAMQNVRRKFGKYPIEII